MLELEEGERQIDLLVNCAGIGTSGPFLAQDWMTEQDLIEVNILALTRMCHALGNAMALHGGGQILNVASVAAFQPGPWMSSYYASKAYVLHFSEGLREELKTCGIKVSVLCPGPTRTAFFGTAQMDTAKLDRSQQLMSRKKSRSTPYAHWKEQSHHHSRAPQPLADVQPTPEPALADPQNCRRHQQGLLPTLMA